MVHLARPGTMEILRRSTAAQIPHEYYFRGQLDQVRSGWISLIPDKPLLMSGLNDDTMLSMFAGILVIVGPCVSVFSSR